MRTEWTLRDRFPAILLLLLLWEVPETAFNASKRPVIRRDASLATWCVSSAVRWPRTRCFGHHQERKGEYTDESVGPPSCVPSILL